MQSETYFLTGDPVITQKNGQKNCFSFQLKPNLGPQTIALAPPAEGERAVFVYLVAGSKILDASSNKQLISRVYAQMQD